MKIRNGLARGVPAAVALIGISLTNGACTSAPVDVKRDAQVDVARYKTYAWISEPEAKTLRLGNPNQIDFMTGFSKLVQRPDIEPQLKAAVDQALGKQGKTAVTGAPDFYVTYFGKAKDEDWISTWSGTVPSVDNVPLVMFPGFDRTSARSYRDGNLLLVFYDAKTKSPVWTGIMPQALSKQHVDLATITADLDQLVGHFNS